MSGKPERAASNRPGGRGEKKKKKGNQQRESFIGVLRGEERRGGRDGTATDLTSKLFRDDFDSKICEN